MPAKLSSKQTRVVRSKITEYFTDIKIKLYSMDDETGILTIVYWTLLDGEINSNFLAEEFSGEELTDVILGDPTPGKNRREDNKTVLYSLLLGRLGVGGVVS